MDFTDRPEVLAIAATISGALLLYIIQRSFNKQSEKKASVSSPPLPKQRDETNDMKPLKQVPTRPAPTAATTIESKPQRDVKDFATDFCLTESTMNEGFATSPKLKKRGGQIKKEKGSSFLEKCDTEFLLEELSPDVPSQRQ